MKDIEAHEDTNLIFEVHVKPKPKELPPDKGPEARGPHNGYPLCRFPEKDEGVKDKFIQEDIRWRNFGWSFLPIFNKEDELNAGFWKLPINKPPANVNLDLSTYANELIRIPNVNMWM